MEAEIYDDEEIFDPVEEDKKQTKIFTISSYGADYPLEIIPSRIDSRDWYAPTFQRNFVWSLGQASRFIESLLLGLPVPGIFLFKEMPSGKHLIIDGQQRTKTIELFLNGGEFGSKKFRLKNVAEKFEGKSFEELEDDDQRRLRESILHATIFTQQSPEDGNDSVYEVFERINTGGSKLSAQEIRSCISHGPFVLMLENLSQNDVWRKVFRSNGKRLKDHELILRFYAFLYNLDGYTNPMKKFLDDQMEQFRNVSYDTNPDFPDAFLNVISFITDKVGHNAFRPDRSFNAAAYDSIMVETAKLLSKVGDVKDYAEKYTVLVTDPVFLELTMHTTADAERLRKRFARAREILSS